MTMRSRQYSGTRHFGSSDPAVALERSKSRAKELLSACVAKLSREIESDDNARAVAVVEGLATALEVDSTRSHQGERVQRLLRRELDLAGPHRRGDVIYDAVTALIGIDEPRSGWRGDRLSPDARDALLLESHELAFLILGAASSRRLALERGQESKTADGLITMFYHAANDQEARRFRMTCVLGDSIESMRALSSAPPNEVAMRQEVACAHARLVNIDPAFAYLDGDLLRSEICKVAARGQAKGRGAHSLLQAAGVLASAVGAFGDVMPKRGAVAAVVKEKAKKSTEKFTQTRKVFWQRAKPRGHLLEWEALAADGRLTLFSTIVTVAEDAPIPSLIPERMPLWARAIRKLVANFREEHPNEEPAWVPCPQCNFPRLVPLRNAEAAKTTRCGQCP